MEYIPAERIPLEILRVQDVQSRVEVLMEDTKGDFASGVQAVN